jgi:hypothetical protein
MAQPEQEPTVPDNSQDWAGMSGADAYMLIQRHADGWADVSKMMGEWLAANTPPAAQPTPVPEGWKLALDAAVSALYFDDSSDFRAGLGAVIHHLDPQLAGQMLAHPKAAYDKVQAMLATPPAAAKAPVQPEHCGPSSSVFGLAEMILSDCGCSSDYQPLLNRVAARIMGYIDTPPAAQPEQQDLADEVIGCFEAAEIEGLTAALANTTDEHLKDLVERRLMHALYAAQATKEKNT